MEDSLPHTPNRTHKGKAVGLRPHLKSCHCLWSYIVKSVSEQRFPLTAACALRLGRCVQTGFPSCPSHGAAAVPRASMQGIFCLPVHPTSLTWTHPPCAGPPAVGHSWPASTPAGSCHIQPHQHQQMGTALLVLSWSAGLSSHHRRLTGDVGNGVATKGWI